MSLRPVLAPVLLLLLLLLLLVLHPLNASPPDDAAARALFAQFKRDYRRTGYGDAAEEAYRFRVFRRTLARVAARNAAAAARPDRRPDVAVHGVTQFADMTPREFRLMSSRRAQASSSSSFSMLLAGPGDSPMPYDTPASLPSALGGL